MARPDRQPLKWLRDRLWAEALKPFSCMKSARRDCSVILRVFRQAYARPLVLVQGIQPPVTAQLTASASGMNGPSGLEQDRTGLRHLKRHSRQARLSLWAKP